MLTDFGGIWTTSTRRFAAMALINDVVGFSLPVAEKSRHLYIRASSKCISLSILIHPHPSFPSCPIHPILSPTGHHFLANFSHHPNLMKSQSLGASPQEFPAKCWTQLSGSLMKSWSKHPQASAWLRRPPPKLAVKTLWFTSMMQWFKGKSTGNIRKLQYVFFFHHIWAVL